MPTAVKFQDKVKLDEIDKEILSVFEECRQEGLTKEEIIQIFSPLGVTKAIVAQFNADDTGTEGGKNKKKTTGHHDNGGHKKKKNGWGWFGGGLSNNCGLSKDTLIILTLMVAVGMTSYIIYPEVKHIKFHGLAMIRMALIKILPVWKWTDYYYTRCLVRNPFFEAMDLNPDDCNLCETLEEIDRLSNVSQGTVIEQYIKREKPFVVTDAMMDWPIMTTDQLWFDNITEMFIQQDKFYVCNLNTNLRGSSYGEFNKILKKLYNPHTSQWFLHWENCQKDGAKATRQFYRRPYFVSNSLDFTGSNWILMSSDFKGRVYKKIDPSESLMMLYQIRGLNHIRLSPRDTCRDQCPELSTTLNEGEILVVENLLWVMEYIPGVGDNLAIISEVSWPSLD